MRKNTSNPNTESFTLFIGIYEHLLKNCFSMDGSYYCLLTFCQKYFLIASLTRNDQKYWFWAFYSLQLRNKIYHKTSLKNMLVSCNPSLFFRIHPAYWKNFFYHFEMDKIALILIYFTWFSNSLLCSTSSVYFFCNVHATIMTVAHFNPHNLQLAVWQLHWTSFPLLPLLHPTLWMEWWCKHSLEGQIDGNFNEALIFS